jgi:hypothetical protein
VTVKLFLPDGDCVDNRYGYSNSIKEEQNGIGLETDDWTMSTFRQQVEKDVTVRKPENV